MSKIRFKRNWMGDGFTCGCHFDCNGKDHSGDYYPAAKVRALVEATKKYQEMAMLLFDCKYEDLAAARELFKLSCINLNAALAALEMQDHD